MKIFNIGSCCIDNVYVVDHFVKPGETLPASGYRIHPGGKGLNQSLALARAGATVVHAGKIGHDGIWLRDLLSGEGVDTRQTVTVDTPTGHALIQIDSTGENAIVIVGGANRELTDHDFIEALKDSRPGDILLMQNEISNLGVLMELASGRDLRLVFNAAPATQELDHYPLDLVDTFILNETEGEAITGRQGTSAILDAMIADYPTSRTLLTLGAQGAIYSDREQQIHQPAYRTRIEDTTGAGDTFIGYYLAARMAGTGIRGCLEIACKAAAICVSRAGAATSIPTMEEVRESELIPVQ